MMISKTTLLISFLLAFFLLSAPVSAFGAGNIASIARIEGKNFRHGDIEDVLKTLTFLKGGKWTNRMIRRVYFGNWLRDYSQAIDVGTVKSVPGSTIRILVWLLSLLSFGYATGEFEVTEERLGVYRPEEHIDNPKDYADNLDARRYDARLRPPVLPEELAVDPTTCMKNYIANEHLGIATSAGYIKHSLNRSIHYGRLYTSGPKGQVNSEANLCEALRCLGQALHTLEDFSAHSNYVELVFREMGMLAVFPHVGLATEMILPNAKRVFPLVTGTFGGVDFLHSVLGEAQDKFTQSELEEMDLALGEAHQQNKSSGNKHEQTSLLKDLLSKVPGGGALAADAEKIEAASDEQEKRMAQPHEFGSRAAQATPGGFDAIQLSQQIMPILQFKDNVTRWLEDTVESIPGLSSLVETISDTLSVFVFSVLAPYIRPMIQQANLELKEGSSSVIASAGAHQFEVWNNIHSSDPTHSMLSKDHFSNILNPPAGLVAQEIVKYVVPRIVHCWENVNVDVNVVFADICQVLHHPGLRHPTSQIQTIMFDTVTKWTQTYPGGTAKLETDLSSESVKAGHNHKGGFSASCGHGKVCGGEWDKQDKKKKHKGDKKKEAQINIGGVKVPTAGLNIPGVAGDFLSGAMAGLALSGTEQGKKEKKDKEKDKYKDEKDKKEKKDKDKNKDKYYDDGYDPREEKGKKEKEKKDKDKKDKKEKKDKYYGGRDDYDDDDDQYSSKHDKHDKYDKHDKSDKHDKHDKKYRDYSPHKRSSSRDRGHYYHHDAHYHEDERAHSLQREHEGDHYHGGNGRYYDEDDEQDYEYEIQRKKHFSPPSQHALGPYALTDPYMPASRKRSVSPHRYSHCSFDSNHSAHQGNLDVEVEFAVPVPVAPLPPPDHSSSVYAFPYSQSTGYVVDVQYTETRNEVPEDIGTLHDYQADGDAYFHKYY